MEKIDVAFVVDDDLIFTHIVRKQMEMVGFSETTMVFHNGLDAVTYIEETIESEDKLPSVILLDINMPVLDGWQFLDRFTQLTPKKKITVYMVSSSIDQNDHAKAATYKEVSKFYIKPLSKIDLMDMLKKAS